MTKNIFTQYASKICLNSRISKKTLLISSNKVFNRKLFSPASYFETFLLKKTKKGYILTQKNFLYFEKRWIVHFQTYKTTRRSTNLVPNKIIWYLLLTSTEKNRKISKKEKIWDDALTPCIVNLRGPYSQKLQNFEIIFYNF